MTFEIHEDAVQFQSDASRLHGTLFVPLAEDTVRTVVIVNAATGVAQNYYASFARWVAAEQGMPCLTYDYRDFGASLNDQGVSHPRRSRASMTDWALRDQPAARAEMRRRFPGARIWVVGHSLGAMLTPVQSGLEDVERIIGVASGMVHVHDHPWPYRWLVNLFWYGHVPPIVAALGYLPGRFVGFGADLPAQAYWQWRRWCTTQNSYFADTSEAIANRSWRAPEIQVDFHAMSDDVMAPVSSVSRLVDRFGTGNAALHVHEPPELGLQSIGHLGAFRRVNAALWPRLLGG